MGGYNHVKNGPHPLAKVGPPRVQREKVRVSLGTFVWPRTPFPYFFHVGDLLSAEKEVEKEKERGKGRGKENGINGKEKDRDKAKQGNAKKSEDIDPLVEDKKENTDEIAKESQPQKEPEPEIETRVTIYIPSSHLPTEMPAKPQIWGGGLNPHPYALPTRIYTDDSDLFLCALHAGFVTWSGTRAARKTGKDLRLDLRIYRAGRGWRGGDEEGVGRFVGGWGERCLEEGGTGSGTGRWDIGAEDDDGRSFLSSGWGSTHDGSGIEVLGAIFVEVRLWWL
jgi:hypothetical protein